MRALSYAYLAYSPAPPTGQPRGAGVAQSYADRNEPAVSAPIAVSSRHHFIQQEGFCERDLTGSISSHLLRRPQHEPHLNQAVSQPEPPPLSCSLPPFLAAFHAHRDSHIRTLAPPLAIPAYTRAPSYTPVRITPHITRGDGHPPPPRCISLSAR